MVDYFARKVYYGTINAAKNGLENLNTIWLCDGEIDPVLDTCVGGLFARPVNVTISPDGKTALVAISSADFPDFSDPLGNPALFTAKDIVNVLEIRGPGDVIPGTPFFLHLDPGGITGSALAGNQSIQFRNNKEAYVVSQRIDPDGLTYPTNQLSRIWILGPGVVELEEPAMVDLLGIASSQYFGVDVEAIKGKKALVGHVSSSDDPVANPYYNYVACVDLNTGTMTPVPLNIMAQPFGIAIK
jgi:hypothetical protein